jgi:hypothetical protein
MQDSPLSLTTAVDGSLVRLTSLTTAVDGSLVTLTPGNACWFGAIDTDEIVVYILTACQYLKIQQTVKNQTISI